MSFRNFTILCLFLLSCAWGQEQIIKKCPSCGYIEKRDYAQFCLKCGDKLQQKKVVAVWYCPTCKKIIDKGGKFCIFCGRKGKLKYQEVADENYMPKVPHKQRPLPPVKPRIEQPQPRKKIKYTYPGSQTLEKFLIDEGLSHTSRQRKIKKIIYTCPGTSREVESFYRGIFDKLGVMRVVTDDVFNILKLKHYSPYKVTEIALYSFEASKFLKRGKAKHQRIIKRLNKELRAVKRYDKEIAALYKLMSKNKLNLRSRIDELKRRRASSANSSTYWDLKAMELVCRLKQNILLVTITLKR